MSKLDHLMIPLTVVFGLSVAGSASLPTAGRTISPTEYAANLFPLANCLDQQRNKIDQGLVDAMPYPDRTFYQLGNVLNYVANAADPASIGGEHLARCVDIVMPAQPDMFKYHF